MRNLGNGGMIMVQDSYADPSVKEVNLSIKPLALELPCAGFADLAEETVIRRS